MALGVKGLKKWNAKRKKQGLKPIKRTSKKVAGVMSGRTYSSYASYEKKKASMIKKIRKIQLNKNMTKKQFKRMEKLIDEYGRRFT